MFLLTKANFSNLGGIKAMGEERQGINPALVINDYTELATLCEIYRKQGRTIVLTMGTFDILHEGHVLYLKAARAEGGFLVVGVDSDEKVRARKGPDRPIVTEGERIEMLTHIRYVDVVTLKPAGAKRWELIRTIHPDVLIATQSTYKPQEITELEKICGTVKVLPPQAQTSTTGRIRLLAIGLGNKLVELVTGKLSNTITQRLTAKIAQKVGEALETLEEDLTGVIHEAMQEVSGQGREDQKEKMDAAA